VARWYSSAIDIDDRKQAKKGFVRKTPLSEKKSTNPRCLKKLLELSPLGWNRVWRPTGHPNIGDNHTGSLAVRPRSSPQGWGELVLYRGEHSNQPGSPSVLLLAPASMQPALEPLKKIEHEYSLRDELDSAWAVRSLAISEQRGLTTLVLEDPGGEPPIASFQGP
jgi:hypothetical protein